MAESYIDDPKARKRMRDNFPGELDRALTVEFPAVGFSTYWDPVSIAARPVTVRNDRRQLNVHQRTFISGFYYGWAARERK